jgi:hypothetical protein
MDGTIESCGLLLFHKLEGIEDPSSHLAMSQGYRRFQAATVHGTNMFYFTNNLTTYWIAASGSSSSPGLHALIEDICLLELELQCCLQVVYVPGWCGNDTAGY